MKAPVILSAVLAITLSAAPASARNNHTTNFLLGAGAGAIGLGLAEALFSSDREQPVSYAPPAAVYAPPPVVYAPPAAVYAPPPPVVYAPPPVYAYPPDYAYAPVCEVFYDPWGRPFQRCR